MRVSFLFYHLFEKEFLRILCISLSVMFYTQEKAFPFGTIDIKDILIVVLT